MPQHLWIRGHTDRRRCDVCDINQRWNSRGGVWMPEVSVICSGDEDDSGRRRPAPQLSPDHRRPVLDDA